MAQTHPFIKDGILTYHRDGQTSQLVVDSTAWYAWLQTAFTFTFCSEYGTFTVHKERTDKPRRGLYWSTYHTHNGMVRRVNLGPSKKVTLHQLMLVAFQLFEARAETIVSDEQVLDEKAGHRSSFAYRRQPRLMRASNHPLQQQVIAKETSYEVALVKPRRSILPVPLTPFIGRAQEMTFVQDLLQSENVRLVTLTGPGGSGKTRMALQVATRLYDNFPDGVCFVDLAPQSDPELVIPTIAHTFALKDISGQPLFDVLIKYLQEKQLLLLLDNFEQVVSAASQLTDLLIACPKLKALVTSRSVLHVRGEQEFVVPPLALPDPHRLPDQVALSQYEAVALFIMRAQAVKPEFQVTDANALSVAQICIRLDGLPLAIELAATRMKLLPPQALLTRLCQRLQVLTSGARDAPMRQQTLRNSIAWSYDLLEAEEQQLFRRLSVFVGGCSLEATEAISGALVKSTEKTRVLDGVASLIDKSLLQQMGQDEDEPRLTMLEIIREYAQERLTASGEEEHVRYAYANYYLAFVEKAEQLLKGTEQLIWLRRLDREQENLRATFNWLISHEEAEKVLRFCSALWRFWETRGYWREGRRWLKAALALPEAEKQTAVRARALSMAGLLAALMGEIPEADQLLSESMILFKDVGDEIGVAHALSLLGGVFFYKGDPDAAVHALEECIALCRKYESTWELSRALNYLGALLYLYNDSTHARALVQEGLMLARQLGDRTLIAEALNNLGHDYYLQGDLEQARTLTQEGLTLVRELGGFPGVITETLGSIAFSQGDLEQATLYFTEGLLAAQASGEESLKELLIAWHCIGLAKVAVEQNQMIRAARLFSAAETGYNANKEIWPQERDDYIQVLDSVRARLEKQAFEAARAEGRIMTIKQILAEPDPVSTPRTDTMINSLPTIDKTSVLPTHPDDLTPREVEVLRLVAQGLTDEQIAKQLIISPRTVNSHLTSIYRKIGVSTRSAATRYVIEHQFV